MAYILITRDKKNKQNVSYKNEVNVNSNIKDYLLRMTIKTHM